MEDIQRLAKSAPAKKRIGEADHGVDRAPS